VAKTEMPRNPRGHQNEIKPPTVRVNNVRTMITGRGFKTDIMV
jgi:hypothetical protein